MIKKTVNVSLAVLTMICALSSVAAAKGDLGIGTVTWHAAKFLGKSLVLTGYVLARGPGYLLFSDEPSGSVSRHDLPVEGAGIDSLEPKTKYVITGRFVAGSIGANGNPDHFELSQTLAPAVSPGSN